MFIVVVFVSYLCFKYSPGGEYQTYSVVVVVCEHGESPALRQRHEKEKSKFGIKK